MTWNVAEAKAKFSELVVKSGERPQVIRNRGREVAVLLSMAEFERLSAGARVDQVTTDDQVMPGDQVTTDDQVTSTPMVTTTVAPSVRLVSTLPTRAYATRELRLEED